MAQSSHMTKLHQTAGKHAYVSMTTDRREQERVQKDNVLSSFQVMWQEWVQKDNALSQQTMTQQTSDKSESKRITL